MSEALKALARRIDGIDAEDRGLGPAPAPVPYEPPQPVRLGRKMRWATIWGTSLLATGITFIATHPDDTLPGAGDWIAWGIGLALIGLAIPAVVFLGHVLGWTLRKRREMLERMTPEQRGLYQAAEAAAAVAATMVELHRFRQRHLGGLSSLGVPPSWSQNHRQGR